MPAYVIALIETVTDPEAYGRYVQQVEATLAPFGGRFLARKPGPEVLEGAFSPSRAIILGFPSEEAVRAWHASPAYQPVMRLRQSASRGTLLLLPAYASGQGPALHEVCYVETVTPDVASTVRLHEAVHGWSFASADPVLGSARVATLPGGARFAVRAPMHEAEEPITRAYVRVPDLDAAVARAKACGAHIALPEMELGPYGRIAIWQLGGIDHGAWQMP